MVGINGYGADYIDVLAQQPLNTVKVVGAVDPHWSRDCGSLECFHDAVPVYKSLKDCFEAGHAADLVVIASPIHHHIPQSVLALKHGCHVLCEKPLGSAIQEATALMDACDRSDRSVRIGYQWSYSRGIQALKNDIRTGRFGAPIRLKTICLWPRTTSYYQRNTWAGKLREAVTGRWILDSPLNNAQAHFLHNLFFLVGPTASTSAFPIEVTAEACRVNHIESFDTVACRARTAENVEILFYGSHASQQSQGPRFELEFERARVTFDANTHGQKNEIIVEDGTRCVDTYPSPVADGQFVKLDEAIRAVSTAQPVSCGPEAAMAQTLCANGVHESLGQILTVSDDRRRMAHGPDRCWIAGLDADFQEAYQLGVLPSEIEGSLSVRGRTVDLKNYDQFPSREVGS